jgi:hypothetical protein
MRSKLTGGWAKEKAGGVFTREVVSETCRAECHAKKMRERTETISRRAPYHSSMKQLITVLFLTSALLGVSACNGESQSAKFIEPDWIDDPGNADGSSTAPSPTPTVTANPTPSATPDPSPSGTATYTGPAEMAKYVDKFVADALIQGVDVLPKMKNPGLTIQIASLDSYGSSVIGLCETGTNTRRVTFDPDFWNTVSETQRELVAHHELGHCILYRAHDSSLLSSGKYASIMYPIIMSSATYTSNYDYYQEELFSTAK